jgi:hypothetical protein
MLYEIGGVMALSGQRPWIGASDETTEIYRVLGAALVVNAMSALRSFVAMAPTLSALRG